MSIERTSSAEASTANGAAALVGQIVAERYRVDALLGSGAMGTVYRAQHVHTRKPVALKVLQREMTNNQEVVARFEREAIASARVEHPNVAGATDFGKLEDGSFYLVLEYVAGRSLSSQIEGGVLPIARALRIARQIAEALSAAHDAGVVHRDLKPDNVMLVEREMGEQVKVLDFGVAKIKTDDGRALTQLGTIMGTPAYMAPEQALGKPVDHRTDLYALGAILYEMLAGHTPFHADDVTVLLTRLISEPAAPLPDRVPPEVRALVERLLAKEPENRFGSAAEASAELGAVLERLEGSRASTEPSMAAAELGALGPTGTLLESSPEARPESPNPPDGESSELVAAPASTAAVVAPPALDRGRTRRRVGFVAAGIVLSLVVAGGGILLLRGTSRPLDPVTTTAPIAPPETRPAETRGPDEPARTSTAPKASPIAGPGYRAPEVPSAAVPAASAPDEPSVAPSAKPAPRATESPKGSGKKAPAKKQKKRTGPGGIYIPPPSEWF